MNTSPQNGGDPRGHEPILQTVAEPLQQLLKKHLPSSRQTIVASQRQPELPFRPINRQPLSVLTILDDGQTDQGEQLRIRNDRVVIGRTAGDVVIPFDRDMSSEHCELRCQSQQTGFRWYLIDKESRNGTFVRAYRASLFRDTELILGSRRYRFELPSPAKQNEQSTPVQTRQFEAPSRTLGDEFVPRLVELGLADGEALSFSLQGSEARLGLQADCDIVIPNDPFLSPDHARFYRDERGRWMIEDRKSLNGVWVRIRRIPIDQPAEFQLGQQRFRFQPSLPNQCS